MQTFLPYPDFEKSAYSLDRQRLGKQRVETLQIMQALFGQKLVTKEKIHTGIFLTRFLNPYTDNLVDEENLDPSIDYVVYDEELVKTRDLPREKWHLRPLEMPGWASHPATNMWRGHEWSLLNYQAATCEVWTGYLGHMDSCFNKTVALYFWVNPKCSTQPPAWLGDEDFHRSHQSNLIRKDRDHYGPLFPNVPDDLPYVWPV